MAFPQHRPRRLRSSPRVRDLVRETALAADDFILPLFVTSHRNDDRPIAAIPGSRLLSGKPLIDCARTVRDHGVPAVLLFAVLEPSEKDLACTAACSRDGAVQKAMSELKSAVPDLLLIDGGKGQLNAAMAAFRDQQIKPPTVISLAKREEEIYRPGQSDPIVISRGSFALRLLQYVRDESHRFAQHYHHLLRSKSTFDR